MTMMFPRARYANTDKYFTIKLIDLSGHLLPYICVEEIILFGELQDMATLRYFPGFTQLGLLVATDLHQ